MATAGLLALLDDLGSLLAQLSSHSKLATKKTAGVLGDDLALNAQQLSGLRAERELAVVWAVAKGSLRNKALLVPTALALSHFAPWSVAPLLMVGGLYLCFEGGEKLVHAATRRHSATARAHEEALRAAAASPDVDLVALERTRIAGAIRTDFVLSAEVVVLALATVKTAPLTLRVLVLCAVSLLMTAGVYGIVAAIVKLDDAGLALSRRRGPARWLGATMLAAAPWLLRFLSVAGTAAMFLVGGGIVVHGVGPLHHAVEAIARRVPRGAGALASLLEGSVGVAAGLLLVLGVLALQRGARVLRPSRSARG